MRTIVIGWAGRMAAAMLSLATRLIREVVPEPLTVKAALISIKAQAQAFDGDASLRVASDMRPSADRQRAAMLDDMQERSTLMCHSPPAMA